ncbi:MAG: hypothetical protein RL582_1085 [Bacteroidota bacterium]|jgi:uncharacterized membrane protein YgdD (TMEM256/DUF423 family)
MKNQFIKIGALSGAIAVALGAFAAHALKEKLDAHSMSIFETASKYQFYHTLALILAAMLYQENQHKLSLWTCRLFSFGMVVFCGSLYALAILGSSYSFLGAITPIGGTMFILGWIFLFLSYRKKSLN